MEAVREAMMEQFEKGLAQQPGGLFMGPSFVDVLPTG